MIAYALNLLDLALTLHALRHGAAEINPLMRCISVMVAYKTIVVGMLCWWLRRRTDKLSRVGLTLITVVYAAVTIWHITNLIGGS